MTRRILVTGGAGYIGSVIVDQLLDQGFSVVVLDDLSTGHRDAVSKQATFVEGNIGDRTLVEGLLGRASVDAIIHLAAFALVSESVARPDKYRQNNVTAARSLLDAAVGVKVGRFIFSSSCAVYGHPPRVPITEDTPQAPVNPYGATKRDFEHILAAYCARHHFAGVSLRYFNAAGATEQRGEDHDPESHLIPNVLAVAAGKRTVVELYGTDYATEDGTAVRDYVHVADIADAHVRALDVPVDNGGSIALNLGTGSGHSVLQVVEAARRITGKPLETVSRPRRAGDPPALIAAVAQAAAVLGWRASRSGIDDILESAWRWHRAHPHGYRS